EGERGAAEALLVGRMGKKADSDGHGNDGGRDGEFGEVTIEELDGEEGDDEEERGLEERDGADPAGGRAGPSLTRWDGEAFGKLREVGSEHIEVDEDDGD